MLPGSYRPATCHKAVPKLPRYPAPRLTQHQKNSPMRDSVGVGSAGMGTDGNESETLEGRNM